MAKQPALNGRELVKALQRAGFEIERVSGSHHILKRPGPPPNAVIVPVHGSRNLKRGTIASILKKAGLTPGDLT